jgi:hypothetical protein
MLEPPVNAPQPPTNPISQNQGETPPKSLSEAWWREIQRWPRPLRYAALATVSIVALGFAGWSALPEHLQEKIIQRLHVPWTNNLPALPENTGWLFLGFYNAENYTFDAEGPSFTFVKRLQSSHPQIPSKGDVIRLEKRHRVMMTKHFGGRWAPLEHICSEEDTYDPENFDTGVRLPKGAQLVIRDIQDDCRDYRQSGNWVALWVRVQYPRE